MTPYNHRVLHPDEVDAIRDRVQAGDTIEFTAWDFECTEDQVRVIVEEPAMSPQEADHGA